jgi:DNA-binding winged helix-turn-helix (wHTH) protein/predicted negative regulator of RcsB-dependent stress response
MLPRDQLSFGPFCLDAKNSRVFRDGADLGLRPQAFSVLKVLLQRIGIYVDYDELIRDAWDGTIVSRHTVASTVGATRKALNEYGSWISYRPKLGYRLEVPATEELIRTGWHHWNRRTREGIEMALQCFEQAALQNPADPAACDGMSSCYLVLATFGLRPAVEVYEPFREAQERAVALRGWTPKLRAERARLLYLLELKFEEAERELELAVRENPETPVVYMYLAMLHAALGRLDQAMATLALAYSTDPLYPTLPATEIFIRFCRREFNAAVDCGTQGLDLHPYLHLGRAYYAQALEFSGQAEEALAQYRLACVISPAMHWLRALEARCLVNTGKRDEALEILEDIERTRLSEYVDAYYVALLFDALGRREEAFNELERALDENSPTLYMLDVDPKMDPLRADPGFVVLRDKVFAHVRTETVHR